MPTPFSPLIGEKVDSGVVGGTDATPLVGEEVKEGSEVLLGEEVNSLSTLLGKIDSPGVVGSALLW